MVLVVLTEVPMQTVFPKDTWYKMCILLFFQDERARIEALGGCVTYMDCWRVNGTLAVSRAIGKHQHSSDQALLECAT